MTPSIRKSTLGSQAKRGTVLLAFLHPPEQEKSLSTPALTRTIARLTRSLQHARSHTPVRGLSGR